MKVEPAGGWDSLCDHADAAAWHTHLLQLENGRHAGVNRFLAALTT